MTISKANAIPLEFQWEKREPQQGAGTSLSNSAVVGQFLPKQSIWETEMNPANAIGGDSPDYDKDRVLKELWGKEMLGKVDSMEEFNNPTQEMLDKFAAELESGTIKSSYGTSYLNTSVNSSNLTQQIDTFTSTYVALANRLGADSEEASQYLANGKEELVQNYTQELVDTLGLSTEESEKISQSLNAMIDNKISDYQSAYETLEQPDESYLANHDGYMATQLRNAEKSANSSEITATKQVSETSQGKETPIYSMNDLTALSQVSEQINSIVKSARFGSYYETSLGMSLAMASIKAEKMIETGLVSEDMSSLIRESMEKGADKAIAAANEKIQDNIDNRHPTGNPLNTFAKFDENLVKSVVSSVTSTYEKTGDLNTAMGEGLEVASKLLTGLKAENPNVSRYGLSMRSYISNFFERGYETEYNAPSTSLTLSNSMKEFEKNLASSGGELRVLDANRNPSWFSKA